jgi:hypothetical protein
MSNTKAQVEGKAPEEERGHPTFYLHSPDPDAERLADLLTHSCKSRERGAGDRLDPLWRCRTCGATRPVSWRDLASWFVDTREAMP